MNPISVNRPGDRVLAQYKTGEYIGQVHEFTGSRYVIQVLAVARHPEQGDLHHPHQADVPLFHQRKALARNERVLVYPQDVRPWNDEIPDYAQSLQTALQAEVARMATHPQQAWATRALMELQKLAAEYLAQARKANARQ